MNIPSGILEIIESGRCEGNLYFLPEKRLPRKVYVKVAKILNDLGGNWDTEQQAFAFYGEITMEGFRKVAQ